MKKKKLLKQNKRLRKACNELNKAWDKKRKTISGETVGTLIKYCW